MKPFPLSTEAKKAVHAEMVAAAPELMDEIAQLRKQFSGAKVRHFKAGDIEYGNPAKAGWVIPEGIDREATRKAQQAVIDANNKMIQKAKARRSR